MQKAESDIAEEAAPSTLVGRSPDGPRLQFSMAILFRVIAAMALLLGLGTSGGFTGFLTGVSLLLVILVWRSAPKNSSFQKSLVVLFAWGGALLGLLLFDGSGSVRLLGWRAESDLVSVLASGTLAFAIAVYFVIYKRAANPEPARHVG